MKRQKFSSEWFSNSHSFSLSLSLSLKIFFDYRTDRKRHEKCHTRISFVFFCYVVMCATTHSCELNLKYQLTARKSTVSKIKNKKWKSCELDVVVVHTHTHTHKSRVKKKPPKNTHNTFVSSSPCFFVSWFLCLVPCLVISGISKHISPL
jgi:hypothetical protein